MALSIAALMNCIFGFMRSFSINYTMMVALEFLEAGFGAGAYTTAFVLGKFKNYHYFFRNRFPSTFTCRIFSNSIAS